MQNRSRPTSGAIGGLRVGCSDGPRRRQGLATAGAARRARAALLRRVFGVLGLTRARQSFLWPDKSGWRGGSKAIEDMLSECAPHPAHGPYLTHACARATQVPATIGAAAEVLCAGERAQSSSKRRGGDGAAPRAAAAARLGERMWVTAATWNKSQQQRQDATCTARVRVAGEDGTAPWGVSRNQKRAGLLTTSTSVKAPMSPSFSPPKPKPPIPHFMSTARSISSRFPLRRESGAHRLEIGPLLLTYLFSEGT